MEKRRILSANKATINLDVAYGVDHRKSREEHPDGAPSCICGRFS
jgi:hypothetical protein